MALESLDRSPPPFFRVGFAPLTKLIFFGVLSVVLMFGDKQLQFTQPVRAGLATLILPFQWLVLQPGQALSSVSQYFESLDDAQQKNETSAVTGFDAIFARATSRAVTT